MSCVSPSTVKRTAATFGQTRCARTVYERETLLFMPSGVQSSMVWTMPSSIDIDCVQLAICESGVRVEYVWLLMVR